MRITHGIGGLVLAIGFLSAGAAYADGAGTTCADFAKMDSASQDKVIADIVGSPSVTATTTTTTTTTSTKTAAATDTTNKPAAGPLTAGVGVSACQATPTATLGDALSKAGYTGGGATTTK